MRPLRGDIPVIQEQIHARQKQTRGRPVGPSGGGELTEDVRGLTTVTLGRQYGTGVRQGHVHRGDRFECGDRQTVEEQEDRPREGDRFECGDRQTVEDRRSSKYIFDILH